MPSERVPCPCCIRGQIACPDTYPDDVLGTTRRDLTRRIMDAITRRPRGLYLPPPRSALVVCPTCEGSREVGVDVAATVLLTEA